MNDACLHGYAVPVFNVNNMEQMLAIMAAADATDSPVIMQASCGARAFGNDIVLSHWIRVAIEHYPHIPVCMEKDHGNSPLACLFAVWEITGLSPDCAGRVRMMRSDAR